MLCVGRASKPEAKVDDATDLPGPFWLAFEHQHITAARRLSLGEVVLLIDRHGPEHRIVEAE